MERPHWSKKTPQKNHPKQVNTHNVPSYDLENTNGTSKTRNLELDNKPQIVPWGSERMLQKIQTQKSYSSLITASSTGEEETEKSSYGLD